MWHPRPTLLEMSPAGVASSADLAEVVTTGVAPSADPDGDITSGVTSMGEYKEPDVVLSDAVQPQPDQHKSSAELETIVDFSRITV